MIIDSSGQGYPAAKGSTFRLENSSPDLKSGGAETRKDELKKSESFRRKRMELRRIRRLSREKSDGDYGVCLKKKRCEIEKEAKLTENSLGLRDLRRLSHGTISIIGRRRDMEDAVAVELGFLKKGGKSYDFFGVYDGHGGWRVAQACCEMFHKLLREIVEESGEEIDWEKVMMDAFQRMDEDVNKHGAAVETTGSTAVVAVVGAEEIVVANCGDSRVVISRGGVALQLSDDHKPDRPDELERIEDSGGRVINWNGQRVSGVLATSRSIGDQYLKPYVITEPEVKVINRTHQDEFLVLASDGLWDVVSNDLVCQVVRRCLDGRLRCSQLPMVQYAVKNETQFEKMVNGTLAVEAAAVLAELAMARGSRDNISVTVVPLNQSR